MQGTYGTITFQGNTAIKQFSNPKVFYKELFFLSLFKRYKIAQIIDASFIDMTITMERYDGSLIHLIGKTSYEERLYLAGKIIRQILPVIHSLHSHGVAHKDITTANIFYQQNATSLFEFYLGDFSLMSAFNETNYHKVRIREFPDLINLYSDPDTRATIQQTDLWMFGVTLWEFVSKDRFIGRLTPGDFLDYKQVFYDEGVSHYITTDVYKVLCDLLQYNACKRETTSPKRVEYTKVEYAKVEYAKVLEHLQKYGVQESFANHLCKNALYDSVDRLVFDNQERSNCINILTALSTLL